MDLNVGDIVVDSDGNYYDVVAVRNKNKMVLKSSIDDDYIYLNLEELENLIKTGYVIKNTEE